jgi:hypothetical protein
MLMLQNLDLIKKLFQQIGFVLPAYNTVTTVPPFRKRPLIKQSSQRKVKITSFANGKCCQ